MKLMYVFKSFVFVLFFKCFFRLYVFEIFFIQYKLEYYIKNEVCKIWDF